MTRCTQAAIDDSRKTKDKESKEREHSNFRPLEAMEAKELIHREGEIGTE
jgi:hypothetical protein